MFFSTTLSCLFLLLNNIEMTSFIYLKIISDVLGSNVQMYFHIYHLHIVGRAYYTNFMFNLQWNDDVILHRRPTFFLIYE